MIVTCLNGASRLLTRLNPGGNLVFHKATSAEDIRQLQHEFWKRDGVLFPEDYLKAGKCYLVRNNIGELVGTFAIIHGTEPRTLLQLPKEARQQFLKSLKPGERVVETTGVWLQKQRHHLTAAVVFWAKMFTEIYSDNGVVSVFSCDTRKPSLEKMYRQGAGGVVYRGPINALPGMEDNGAQEEVVFFQRKNDFAKGFFRELTRRTGKLLSTVNTANADATATRNTLKSIS
jgi:hypothetical protein